jgi:pimeloyl-ACP methyl ester carboxylesterase
MKRRALPWLIASLVLAVSVSVAAAAPPKHGFLHSDGVKIHYISAGEGEPVILIHGFSASAYLNWVAPGVFDKLTKHYHVIALDNRGHGMSGKPHEIDKYGKQMVEDVVHLMDHLKIQKAHIVGYSMGGFITSALVVTHPERVLSATMGGAGWSRPEDDHSMIEAVAKSLEEGNGIAPLMKALTPPGVPAPTEEQVKSRNQMIMLANDPKALAACIRGMLNLQVTREQLVNNKVPVLAIVGDRDPLKKGVDAMEGVMSNLKVVIVKGGDHMSTFRSALFQQTINDFLAAHSRQPATASAGK